MVYKHAYLNTVVLLHSAFMLSLVKMPLKGRSEAMHQIVMEIIWLTVENHGKIMGVFEFLWEPCDNECVIAVQ